MKNNLPIGFFDSGVGGLSVYSQFRKILPNEDTIYFGDLKNLPYGNKTQNELIFFARNILDFFAKKEVKAVIIACNTSSALAYEHIKNDYDFKIFPIIQSCAKIIAELNYKKIGVFATTGTVNSKAYSREISKYNSLIAVKEIACPNWVSIVEGNSNIDILKDVENHIKEMDKFSPEKIILGCTHYPYLTRHLTKFMPEDMFIDPAKIFVEYIKNNLIKNESQTIGSEDFFVSANPEVFIENAKLFYEIKTLPTIVI